MARRLHRFPRPDRCTSGRSRVARQRRRRRGRRDGRLRLRPLIVAAATGALELLEVQLEGRKRIPAADFANGQRLTENEILGETQLNLPLGYAYSAVYAGIRAGAEGRPGADRQRPARQRRRGVHAEPRAGRAGEALPHAI